MTVAVGFLRSTIGRKVVMAATGLLLVGFLVGHVGGNLLVFKGPEALNTWSAFLKSSALVLWSVRAVLLTAVGLHIWAAVTLTRQNRASRPVAYAKVVPQTSTLAARLMWVGGLLLIAFIVVHLLHLTTGTIHHGCAFSHTDVYGNVVSSFAVPWLAGFYVLAMLALMAHLTHGLWSFLQTMGWNHPRFEAPRRAGAVTLALVISLGFISIVVAVFLGVLT
jgi:succinate dehydrogenase / fumarate reductase cytochrome b subunit